jgi:hypothetical protein
MYLIYAQFSDLDIDYKLCTVVDLYPVREELRLTFVMNTYATLCPGWEKLLLLTCEQSLTCILFSDQ